MGKFVDITGQTFNNVYVESLAGKNKNGSLIWNSICLLCGKHFVAIGGNIKRGSTKSCGCSKTIKNHKKGFQDLTGQLFNSLFVEGYAGTDKYGKSHWASRCLLCGRVVYPGTTELKSGRSKTCGCTRMSNMAKSRMIDLTDRTFGDLTARYIVGKSDSGHLLWYCDCVCGGHCIESSNTLLRGKAMSCGCLKSRNERKIAEWLDNHHIDYERQKTFEGCKNINLLRFDFYVPKMNMVIEYDGEFHYMQIDNLNNDIEYQQNNDRIKDRYCAENNIKVLRIPYWEKDNIESILTDWLFLNTEVDNDEELSEAVS